MGTGKGRYMSISKARRVLDRLYCMGQPQKMDLLAFKEAGITHIINLRPVSEWVGWDQAAMAAELQLQYLCIPVASSKDLDREHARELMQAIEGDEPVLIYCATGNRVGALLALVAAWEMDYAPAQALELGLAAGLTSLEPAVGMLLDLE